MAVFAYPPWRKAFFLFSFTCLLGFTPGLGQQLHFEDVTHSAGVSTPNDTNGYGHGVAAGDFNNDGLPDIYVVSYTALNALFLNDGDGSFTNNAVAAGVAYTNTLQDRGVGAADYDNDGDLDLYIASGGYEEKLLFRNNGNGSFSEIANSVGLRNYEMQGESVSWGDYDGDGDLDLFLTSFENPCKLFRQNSDHSFTDVTAASGLGHTAESVQAVFFDADLDGNLDIFVSRGMDIPNSLFMNRGNGTFVDEAFNRNIADPAPHGQGVIVGDYDNDGDFDIYMCDDQGPNRLYRNNNGSFAEVAEEAGVDDYSRSLGCHFADFDNDGWLDLYVINFGVNRLYHNNGDGSFSDETHGSGADDNDRSYGSVVLDYDGDGFLDIYFSNSGPHSNLLRNSTASGNKWLKFTLRGVSSNRNGIGARIVVTAGGLEQMQQLLAGFAMVSGGGDLTFHFGLGNQSSAERVEVIWPSGQRDVVLNVNANQALTIQEGDYGAGNDTDPPIISNVQSSNLSSASATITWNTNELADSQVEYGLNTAYGSLSALDASRITNHSTGLTGLTANTTYHYSVRSRDAAGNLATSGDFTFITNNQSVLLSDNFPGPNIDADKWNKGNNAGTQAAIESGALTLRSASSHSGWIVTKNAYAGANKIAKLKIIQPNDDGDLGISPTVNLASTNALYGQNNWYRFYVYRDGHAGNYLLFAQWKRNGSVDGLDVTNGLNLPNSFWLRLRTDATTIFFEYSPDDVTWITVYQEEFALPGYSLASSFYYEISGNNTPSNGVLRVDDFNLSEATPSSDTQPPVISRVASGNITTNAATITWNTDEAGDSQVEYGLTTAYGNSSPLDALRITNHSVNLTGLSPNTTYHYRVKSKDAAGNLAVSSDFTFGTPGTSSLSFTDITLSAGTGGPTGPNQVGGHAAIFSDVNNDNRPDLYLTMLGVFQDPMSDLFFRNNGSNVFVEEGAPRGLNDFDGGSHGAVFGDLDNDGDYDLYNGTTDPSPGVLAINNIYRNDGNGFFTDATAASGIPVREWQTRAVVAFDMEGDGDLDLFGVTDYLGTDDPPSDRNEVYRNEGGLQFTAVNSGPLFEARTGQGATDTDFDNDGDIDIFAANRTGDMNILRNDGNGMFTQIPPASLGITHRADDGITTADIDNDGDLDLLLARDDSGTLYRNLGNGTFVFAQNFTATNGYMGGFGDLDNDGDLDLVFAGDDVSYLNDGTGNFTVGPSIAVAGIDDPRAIGLADIDNDGDLDFAFGCKRSRNWLVRNNNASNHWLKIKLLSPQGQAGAFGAKTKIYPAGQAGGALLGLRESRSNNGYLGQDDQIVHFGLGERTAVDVVVRFLDGTTVTAANVNANQTITVNGVSSDAVAPMISQTTASDIANTSAAITWQTNEISSSQVEYGTTTALGSFSNTETILHSRHSVALANLAAQTVYHYRVISQDHAGNRAVSQIFSFTTLTPDLAAPVIGNVTASELTANSARIQWNTDEPATSQAEYGLTTAYGSFSALDELRLTNHSVTLTNLTANTTYHYRVLSRDAAGNLATSGDFTFTTGNQTVLLFDDFNAATIDANKWNKGTNSGNQSQAANNVLELRSTGTQTGWIITKNNFAARNTTASMKITQPNDDGNLGMTPTYALSSTNGIYNQATWYRFYVYRDVAAGPYQLFVQWKKNGVVDGIDVTGNAVLNGSFHMRMRCDDTRIYFEFSIDGQAWTAAYSEPFGLTAHTLNSAFYYELAGYRTEVKGILKADDFTINATTSGPDTQPPVISQVASGNIAATTATITWNTDEASDSQVEYGLTTAYENSTPLDELRITNHSVDLANLMPSTSYHYRVKSKDAAGNLATSNDFTFTTSGSSGNTLLADDFNTGTLDLNKWTKGSNSGNQASVVNNALELRSTGTQTAWIVTKQKYAARNTVVTVKVAQPNNDGNLGVTPTFQASSANGIFNQANWYRFYVYREVNSGPYRLYVQWSKNGAVDGVDVTGNMNITGTVYLRLRCDDSHIHFEASLDGQSWTDTYNEVFALPGYTLDTTFNYELAGYWTDVKGRMTVDDFTIATNSALAKDGEQEALAEAELPTAFELSQNYPNPFYFNTHVRLALPEEAQVHAVIYDLNGREIQQLYQGSMPTGYRVMNWDGTNAAGEYVSSGVYFMRVIFETQAGRREVMTWQLRLMR